jgi:hypothetical protein
MGLIAATHPDPAGAALGVAVSVGIEQTLDLVWTEFDARLLTPFQRRRISRLKQLAIEEICSLNEEGRQPRSDELFVEYVTGRSGAVEITESVVRAAQDDPEERKLAYYANQLARNFYYQNVDAGMAHQITALARSLSYRQLCFLALATDPSRFDLFDKFIEEIGLDKITPELSSIVWDCFDLRQRGLLNTGTHLDMGIYEIRPALLQLQGLGLLLHGIMDLASIANADVASVAALLSFGHGPIPSR